MYGEILIFLLCATTFIGAINVTDPRVNKLFETINISTILKSLHNLNSTSQCANDIDKFIKGIGTEEWALRMFDSSEKVLHGILNGNGAYLGHFDECLAIEEKSFKGKYCTMEVILKFQKELFLEILFGICLPSSCSSFEIENALHVLDSEFFNITVDEKNCWSNDPVTYTSQDWIVIGFLCLVLLIALISTAFDFLHRMGLASAKKDELYKSFSLYSNIIQLLKTSDSAGNIKCLHGIRTLTMCWVILGHEYMLTVNAPVTNTIYFDEFLHDSSKLIITNAFVAVDTFFLLSGMLVTLVFFRDIAKKKYFDVPVSMIHRFIRLTPPFAAMVLIQSTILIKLCRGPLWNIRMGELVNQCRENWWQGLIYLQNWIAPNSTCLGQSWYLSSDMQMFWFSPLLLYPILFWQKLAPVLILFTLMVAMIINFSIAYINKLGPTIFFGRYMQQFEIDYVQTHMRLTPYIVGMGLGYIICGIKAKKIRVSLSMKWIVIGWLISTGLCIGSLFGLSPLVKSHTFLQSSFYLVFHRLGWSLGLAWVIFAIVNDYGGPANLILSWNGFQILGKLSYCMFLVHFTFQHFRLSQMRVNFYMRDFEVIFNYFGDLIFALLLSIPVSLLFEMPFINLDRYYLRNVVLLPYPKPKPEEKKNLDNDASRVEDGAVNKGFET